MFGAIADGGGWAAAGVNVWLDVVLGILAVGVLVAVLGDGISAASVEFGVGGAVFGLTLTVFTDSAVSLKCMYTVTPVLATIDFHQVAAWGNFSHDSS